MADPPLAAVSVLLLILVLALALALLLLALLLALLLVPEQVLLMEVLPAAAIAAPWQIVRACAVSSASN